MDVQNQKLTIEGTVTYSRLFDALKGMYEVDDDDSVWEIFNQADDQIEEVVNALKLLSAPPAPFVDPGLLAQFNRHRLLQIIVTGPDASGAEQNTLARIALAFYPKETSGRVADENDQ